MRGVLPDNINGFTPLALSGDATLSSVKLLGQQVSNSIVEDLVPQTGNSARVIFVDTKAAKNFVSEARKRPQEIAWTGQRGGYTMYSDRISKRYKPGKKLLQEIDEFMEAFAQAEVERERELNEKTGYVDQDGFVKVIKSKKAKHGLQIADAMTKDQLDELEKKRKRKEKPDFYRFQIREKKKEALGDLLQRFQEDKARIEDLKARKRFKPY